MYVSIYWALNYVPDTGLGSGDKTIGEKTPHGVYTLEGVNYILFKSSSITQTDLKEIHW